MNEIVTVTVVETNGEEFSITLRVTLCNAVRLYDPFQWDEHVKAPAVGTQLTLGW